MLQVARDRTRLPRARVLRALPVRRAPRTAILLFHRVLEDASDVTAGDVTTATRFAEQLRALRELGDIVPLSEVVAPSARPLIAVTFDDGYWDNCEITLPILERHGVPATFFVTTAAFADPTEFWWDRLEHLLLDETSPPPRSIEIELRRRRFGFDLTEPAQRLDAHQRLSWKLLYATPDEIERVVESIERACGRRCEPCPQHARMTPSQTRAAASTDVVTIGAHTVHHHCLTALPDDEAQREIEQSRSALGDVIGTAPSLFAYPFGDERSFGRRHSRMTQEAGFDLAVAAVPSTRLTAHGQWRVPRIAVWNRTPEQLKSLVRPFLE